jgi:hypothetical protein
MAAARSHGPHDEVGHAAHQRREEQEPGVVQLGNPMRAHMRRMELQVATDPRRWNQRILRTPCTHPTPHTHIMHTSTPTRAHKRPHAHAQTQFKAVTQTNTFEVRHKLMQVFDFRARVLRHAIQSKCNACMPSYHFRQDDRGSIGHLVGPQGVQIPPEMSAVRRSVRCTRACMHTHTHTLTHTHTNTLTLTHTHTHTHTHITHVKTTCMNQYIR